MAGNEFKASLLAELAGIRGFVAEKLEAGDPAPFLIDGDDRFDLASFTQAVGEGAELGGGLDVPAEKDESPGLDASDEIGIGLVDLITGDAEEQKLTMGGGFHSVQTTRLTLH